MQDHYCDFSAQARRVWQRLFAIAILLASLPMFEAKNPSPVQTKIMAAAIEAHTPGGHESRGHEQYIRAVDAYRSNPHSQITAVAPPQLKALPNLAFSTTLEATPAEHPYLLRPIINAIQGISWENTNKAKSANHTITALSTASSVPVSPYLSLFQPRRKPEPKQWVVVLDAGHGGSDPGALAPNGLVEKELTLEIAKMTGEFLSEHDNVTVVLTRDTDKGMSRGSRVNKVKRSNADIVVSLHFNHLPQSDLNLVETYYAAQHNIAESQAKQMEEQGKKPIMKMRSATVDYGFTRHSERLANIMQNHVYNEVQRDNATVSNAGVKQDTLFILTRSFTPGALIELSCLSNIDEAEKLATKAYRTRMAAAIADGIRDYINTNPKPLSAADLEV